MPINEPVISILLLTYMHEEFVREALDSIFTQELSVGFEVIATEDCSSDRTRIILEEYRQRFPETLFILQRDARVGGKRNLLDGFARCRGNFVCVLDGDDYWTDTHKLSAQLAILQESSQYVACAHNTRALVVRDNALSYDIVDPERVKEHYSLSDLIEGRIYLHSSSLLFRNVFKGALPEAQAHPRAGDYFMSMLFAEHGNIAFIDRVMSVYRMTGLGAWSTLDPLAQRMRNIDGLVVYNKLLRYRYATLFDSRIYREVRKLVPAIKGHGQGKLRALCKYLFLRFAYRPFKRKGTMELRPLFARLADALWFSDVPSDPRLH